MPADFPVTSNIIEHLPILERYGSMCPSILELGCENGTGSTFAFRNAMEKSWGSDAERLWISVDIKDQLFPMCRPRLPFWHFVAGDTTNPETVMSVRKIMEEYCWSTFDLIFIDTMHTYDQMKRELELWNIMSTEATLWLFHDTYMAKIDPITHTVTFPYNSMTDAVKEFANYKNLVYKDISVTCNGLGMMCSKESEYAKVVT